jgi:hypothetical protein
MPAGPCTNFVVVSRLAANAPVDSAVPPSRLARLHRPHASIAPDPPAQHRHRLPRCRDVQTHVGSVLAKLGARDRTQAVVVAYESGLVSPA